jgi:hypothetical protein
VIEPFLGFQYLISNVTAAQQHFPKQRMRDDFGIGRVIFEGQYAGFEGSFEGRN